MSRDTVVHAASGERIGPGTQLNDLYEIDALIAEGGMGAVFRGHSIETGDPVAIKTIRADFAGNATALALFRKEASALHTVHHGAVVRYYVFSIDRRLGLPYLAMEYVTGEPLSERLRRGPLAFAEVDLLRRRIADGLQAAHEAGIVHRDVSPDNVILPGGDPARAKIIDFGIARSAAGQTVIGDGFAGKYSYVSPEQLGLQGGEVTARSDIYGLGLVLAESSRGRPVDMGGSPAEFVSRRAAIPDLTGVDARLVPLVEAMLQPDPDRRPRSMAEVAAWTPAPAPVRPPAPRAGGRRRGLVLGGAAAGLAAAGLAVAMLYPSPPPPTPSGPLLAEQPAQASPPAVRGEPAESPVTAEIPITAESPAAAGAPPRAPPAQQAQTVRESGAAPPAEPPARPEPPTEPVPASVPKTAPGGRTQVATVEPPSGPVPRALPSPTMEQVAAYVRGYRGGDCFFLSPTAISGRDAHVEAYGARTRAFEAFDADFKRTFGFEARILLHRVEGGQCPVVDLLARQAQIKPASAPKIRLESDRIRSGESLRGVIDFGDGTLKLLLVEGDGSVHDLGPYLRRAARQAVLSVRLDAKGLDRGRPQLLVAVVSRAPLPALERAGPWTSEAVFREIAQGGSQEVSQPGSAVGVAVTHIEVGG
ncbi:serine/threonine-protein kinase [Methylobacterium sp. NEAU 140]|uniref:serine/threonine-protein kinase n=1 Tax=Methylobacterium sp. NEAU 140 TaxID=3064945 RepID=UPI002732A75D|nr:serine/threonine-protein kinase [Methylobacterium sp. NEAU 140]MDP4024939.1 serine/threonine-protein kinase [Methylobacterium sp. NEAU 140]